VLDVDDIPGDPARFPLENTIEYEYPVGERFSLQLVGDLGRGVMLRMFPNNIDAAFKRGTHLPKPSALLLHYNYGAAIVKLWGHRTEVLDQPNIRRPQFVINHKFKGPSKSRNQLIAIGTDTSSYLVRVSDGSEEAGEIAGGGAIDATDNQTVVVRRMVGYRGWDEDDWMLFFCGNTPAARERHRAAEEESSNRIGRWATEVSNAESVESPSPE